MEPRPPLRLMATLFRPVSRSSRNAEVSITRMLSTLLSYFARYGFFVVFFGVMLENAGVPVPGETILLAAGFFAAQGHFHLWTVIVVAAVGAMLGDNAGYAVGHRVGRAALERYGRYILLTRK